MWKEYKETFDGVHASQRLRTEVLNMKREENARSKRRVPAAALAAAALVIALAGTAVAEHLGWVRIEPINNWFGPDGPEEGSSYAVTHENRRFPAENLSDEVFAIGEEIGDVHRPHRAIAFESWTACEDFLGVELANNSRLDQMQRKLMQVDDDDIGGETYAYVSLGYEERMPAYASVSACYQEGYQEGYNIDVMQSVLLRTQYACERDQEQWDFQIPQNGGEPLTYETYITAGGIEAVIFTETYDTPISTYTSCYASFIRDNMLFSLNVSVKTHEYGEPTNAPDVMELTKEILDAYE